MGIVEHVDPNMIMVEANVRTEANLLREFVASIKQNGARPRSLLDVTLRAP
ncbi:hypothetical protein [Cryobacterium sp. Hz9]|uniref:hypothetical protein n=1 Tax=Cryobacterium sp. Hz9 TaxID=1259167 RepID=UPI00141AD96E|nr:hypothetical protein [Cryobacterium sp. Hz9]